MLKSDFFYDLPDELIAQTPIEPRNHSKILVVDRKTGSLKDDYFYNLKNYLKPGDVLVLNDSRVLPARLLGVSLKTKAPEEFLLLKQIEQKVWEVLTKPGKRAKVGAIFKFNDELEAEVLEVKEDGNRIVRFLCENSNIFEVFERVGRTPLPPYIKAELKDPERYQTVYSKELGSSAAPTAGLHFTKEQLNELADMGVEIEYITLHVGLGTFRPVKEENIENHLMHSEHIFLTKDVADKINKAKLEGRRVIAVGTTSCRTLETCGQMGMPLKSYDGWTSIFIYPGYKFKVIDGLITNFHLPESTLIMLVSAFLGYDNTMNAYKYAVNNKYRFFSFGDSMLICTNS